jgi:hypothetical protein
VAVNGYVTVRHRNFVTPVLRSLHLENPAAAWMCPKALKWMRLSRAICAHIIHLLATRRPSCAEFLWLAVSACTTAQRAQPDASAFA